MGVRDNWKPTALEELLDAGTVRHLEALGVGAGWQGLAVARPGKLASENARNSDRSDRGPSQRPGATSHHTRPKEVKHANADEVRRMPQLDRTSGAAIGAATTPKPDTARRGGDTNDQQKEDA